MRTTAYSKEFASWIVGLVFLIAMAPCALADVYINVMAVNGTDTAKDTSVKYNLPGDLSSQDILDTNGLELDYNVNDANYYVHGKVSLQPKESKTFRIKVRDVWKLSPEQVDSIKNQIEQGYDQIGKLKDPQQGEQLKEHLLQKLNFVQEQSSKADTVEKRIDSFRTYSKELQRIENNALAVDYWRSDPSEVKKDKIIRFNIEVENPFDVAKPYKNKHYLPAEIKPEDLVEFEGFEVRFDQDKKQAFLFKEEELQPKEKKKYTIGIRDIWFIPQKDIDYLRSRADYAYDFLKNSKFASGSKILFERANELLKNLEDSQAQKRDNILDHISAFRDNQRTYSSAKTDVESLEKLLSVYREDLDKSKVENVLKKMKSLKGVADISQAVFNKAPTEGVTWKFIGWVLIFVGLITGANFIIWFIRSKEKKERLKNSGNENDQASNEKKTP
jgi:hypothetical protein